MTKISDLPRDLIEEVLSRLPITSQISVRFTCKRWNKLYRNGSFRKKLIGEAKKKCDEEFDVVMKLESKVFLFNVNLNLLSSPSLKRIGEFTSLDVADRVEISQIFICDGLFLCIPKDRSRLMVSNPFCGQPKWIEPFNSYDKFDHYALGYEKNKKSYKILRFISGYDWKSRIMLNEFEIFDINTNSWKVLDVTPNWVVGYDQRGLSLKDNTYWYAQEKIPYGRGRVISDAVDFLLCFDFTMETFGPGLPLPFHAFMCPVTLSSVRDEQLAILLQRYDTLVMDIWVTTTIKPTAVSWNKFISVDMKPLTGLEFSRYSSFFIDEKKKVAVVVDQDRKDRTRFHLRHHKIHNMAYIIGENGYLRKVDLGEFLTSVVPFALVCSYLPSSVQIRQANRNTP